MLQEMEGTMDQRFNELIDRVDQHSDRVDKFLMEQDQMFVEIKEYLRDATAV